MKDLLKGALSPFLSFDESKPAQKSDSSVSVKDSSKTVVVPPANLDKFQNYFSALMEKLDLPGPDYFEFAKAVKDLESDVPNQDSRFKVAFKSLKASGLTKEILLSSGAKYLSEFEKDKEVFTKQVSEKETQEIESRNKEIGGLETENKSIDDQIQKLQKEKESNLQKIESLKTEIQTAEAKIHNNEGGYRLAYDQIVGKINEDLKKIQTVL